MGDLTIGYCVSKMGDLTIGYWAIRGLGAPLRMMCSYAGVDFTNTMYDSGEVWGKDKAALKQRNPLINLPYLKDVAEDGSDAVTTQSNACLMYLDARLGLQPAEPNLKMRNIQVQCEVMDLRNALIGIVYPFKKQCNTQEEYDAALKGSHTATVKTHYGKLEACLEKWGTPFFSGTKPAGSDFHAFEMMDQHEGMAKKAGLPSFLAEYPKLQAYHANFKALPELAKYFASDMYSLPANNPAAGPWYC